MRKIILVRHGHAYNQVLDLLSGDGEFPLTAKGIQQAKDLKEKIHINSIENIFCSSVLRCQETASLIFGNDKEITLYDELREINVGDMTHMKYPDFAEHPIYKDFGISSGTAFPNGENFVNFKQRIKKFYDSLPLTGTHMIIAHSGVINVILHLHYDIDFNYFPFFNVKNCETYTI